MTKEKNLACRRRPPHGPNWKKKEIIEPGIPSGGKGETGVTEGNVQARILPQILFAGLFKGGDNHCANKLLLPDEEH